MIIFWRLVLAYYICAMFFYNRRFFAWRDRHTVWSLIVQAAGFAVVGGLLCFPYLSMNWEVADCWPVPGWAALGFCSVFYMVLNHLFVERPGQTKGRTAVFFIHDISVLLVLLICSPLYTLAQTGHWAAEAWSIFVIGILVVTRMFSIFVYLVEQDMYGRDFPTMDEKFVTMLMRLIFFLIVLLPGWRWLVWFVAWFWACLVARKNRLMDLSPFAFYFGIFGAAAVGFLVRWGWYFYR